VLEENSTAAAEARSEINRLMNSWVPPIRDSVQVRESTAGTPYPGESPVAQSFDPENLNDTRDLPSPHANVQVLRAYQEAELEYDAERFALCAGKLRELLKDHDDFAMAHKLLAAVNQGRVRNEWQQLGVEESQRLVREAVASLRKAAELAAAHKQNLAVESIHRNLALLLLWLNEREALKSLGEESDDPAIRWMHALATYRRALDAEQREEATALARDVLDAAPPGAGFADTARQHFRLMEQGEPVNIAPWEQ
jgi:hypothetical protein